MVHYNGQLRELQQQTARSKQLEAMITELEHQRDALLQRVSELEKRKLTEQKDVDRLEGRSLAAYFYNVIGKMDEKLDAERREAYAARVKFDAAARELAGVEADLRSCEDEMASLRGCEQQYVALMREKADALKAAGGPNGEQILRLEEKIAAVETQKGELQEAICAGTEALQTTKQIMNSLHSAEDWGTLDIIGGGLMMDIAKHDALDEAQEKVEQLQDQLRKFRTELADVTIDVDLQVNIDGFLRFADYFFDGLFTDWAVMDEIRSALKKVESTQEQISDVITRLRKMLESAEAEQDQLKTQMDELVLQM